MVSRAATPATLAPAGFSNLRIDVSKTATTKPLSCVHFIEAIRSELGGVVSAVVDMCDAMSSRGHRVVVATCDDADAPAEWRSAAKDQPQLVRLSTSRLTKRLIGAAGHAHFAGLAADADVVHLHTPWSPGNYQLARLLRRARVPYLVSVHGMLDHYCMRTKPVKKHALLRLGGRRLFRDASVVHFTAEEERLQASHYIPVGDRGVVEPCLVDLSPYDRLPGPQLAFQTFPQFSPVAPKILFLSRVHPKKGIDLLLRAVASLQDRWPDFQLIIAGPGEDRYVAELTRLAAELKIGNQTFFLGMVRGELKLSLYETADVFVLPTHQENFGLVLPEAMACGAPVVTTRGTDIWRELQQGGVSIVENAPQAIAASIAEILGNPAKAEAMRLQQQTFVRQWLDGDRLAAGYEAMYRGAIARGPAPFATVADRTCDSKRTA
ncbi:GDP-mannose-dependent alpha-(1-6)-phosphatidylinositol monomannoside mannosyltransferase [Lacipirellula limnantheis]|uniref:GDP-mannose-dependent alpha-(1-6)-phosphatidylinositol monomannoside mannosyltransferase n=1 Tax=Lacipirellula limnantheis TaxID=2528024 RepID=A0A517TUA9_9BACT|nr:GDP-mannose-dependent alpha-(1-6)-phosphatidylinositol monomannoside mannosyltransferase [Lacipirellula limnantheis]